MAAKQEKVGSRPTGTFKFIDGPNMNMPRDDSGGPMGDGNDYCRSAEFGDGGRVTGAKSHLSNGKVS